MPASEINRLHKMLEQAKTAIAKQKVALSKRKSRAVKKTAKKSKGGSKIGLKALGIY